MMSKLAACPFVSFGETVNCRGKSCQEDKALSLSQSNIKTSTNNNNWKVVVCAGRRTMLDGQTKADNENIYCNQILLLV